MIYRFPQSHSSRLNSLEFATLFYLIIPWLVFVHGWLKPALAFPIGVLCLSYLVWEFPAGWQKIKLKKIAPYIILFLIALIWWGISGVGGYGWQTSDWLQHNFKMQALILHDWPVYLSQVPAACGSPLVYPVAFYLPSAGIARLIGWEFGNWYLIGQTIFGFALTLFWFHRLLGKKSPFVAIIFPFLGGLDWIGRLLLTGETKFLGHIEWWAGLWQGLQFSSNGALSDYAPQHAIAGWIVTAFLFHRCEIKNSSSRIVLIWALSLFWSPFVFIGLTPFLFLAILRSKRKELLHFSNIVIAPVLGLLGLLYFLSSKFSSPIKFFHVLQKPETIKLYLLVCFLEFGAYALVCRPKLQTKNPNTKSWWYLSILCLLILPLFRYGDFNDLLMRGSIPALFIFWLFITDNVLSLKTMKIRSLILIGLLCIGSVSSLIELHRFNFFKHRLLWATPHHVEKKPFNLDPQYFGNSKSIFFRYLVSQRRDD